MLNVWKIGMSACYFFAIHFIRVVWCIFLFSFFLSFTDCYTCIMYGRRTSTGRTFVEMFCELHWMSVIVSHWQFILSFTIYTQVMYLTRFTMKSDIFGAVWVESNNFCTNHIAKTFILQRETKMMFSCWKWPRIMLLMFNFLYFSSQQFGWTIKVNFFFGGGWGRLL